MQNFNNLCEDFTAIKGKRLWAIDGSTIPLPRNPNSGNYYKSEANEKGWCNTHANLLLDVTSGLFEDCYLGEGEADSQKAHDEQGALFSLVYKRRFDQPTILLLDRGYESNNCLAHLSNIPNLFFVMRVKNDGLRPVRELEIKQIDSVISWYVTTKQSREAREKNWTILYTGSRKGKTNSAKTKIARWDFRTH